MTLVKCCKFRRFEGSWRQNTSTTPSHPKPTYDFEGTYFEECKEAHPEEECPDFTYDGCNELNFSPPTVCWSEVESSDEYDDEYFDCECASSRYIKFSGPYGQGVPYAIEQGIREHDICTCPQPKPKREKTIEDPPFPGGEADRVLKVTLTESIIK